MSRNGHSLYDIEKRVFDDRPYRLNLGTPEQERALMVLLMEFCRQPRTYVEVTEHLAANTECPQDRLCALRMSIVSRCFHWDREGFAKLMDFTFTDRKPGEPSRNWTTEQGLAWLQAQQERAA